MFLDALHDVTVFRTLHRIDRYLAERVRRQGCPHCGGPLHRAYYERRPRGGPDVPRDFRVRMSLCCGRCRRRTLPPSSLFLGRQLYWGCFIVVVVALRQLGKEEVSLETAEWLLDVSRKTLLRWGRFFRREYPLEARWRELRGRISAAVDSASLPGSLLEHVERLGGSPERIVCRVSCLVGSGSWPPRGLIS